MKPTGRLASCAEDATVGEEHCGRVVHARLGHGRHRAPGMGRRVPDLSWQRRARLVVRLRRATDR